MHLYGLKNCDTCRKALKLLPDAEFVDVRADGVPENVLKAAHDRFGDALLNTRSATWRGLSDLQKDAGPLSLLQSHPAVMKRPLITDGDAIYLGWTRDVQTALGVG